MTSCVCVCVCKRIHLSVCHVCLQVETPATRSSGLGDDLVNVRSPNLQGCTASWRVFLIFLLVTLSRCFPGQKPGRELRSVRLSLLASWQSRLRVKNESKSHTWMLSFKVCAVSLHSVESSPFLSSFPSFPPFLSFYVLSISDVVTMLVLIKNRNNEVGIHRYVIIISIISIHTKLSSSAFIKL